MDSNNMNTQNQQQTPVRQVPPAYQPYPAYQAFSVNNIPEEYRPISMWGYFGYQLLFSIPCVGFIILIVFALGGTKNINVKNFARSYFCYFIIIAILIAVLFISGAGLSILSSF